MGNVIPEEGLDLNEQPFTEEEKAKVEELYLQYVNLARYLAKKISTQYGKSYNDVKNVAETRLAYELCERRDWYDEEQSKRSTWLYSCIYWTLKSYCGNNDLCVLENVDNEEFEKDPVQMLPDVRGSLKTLASDLTQDAQLVIDTIIDTPSEIVEDLKPGTKGRAKAGLRWYLENRCNWSKDKIADVWCEVEEWVSEIKTENHNFSGSPVVELSIIK